MSLDKVSMQDNLRKKMRLKRSQLSANEISQASKKIVSKLIRLPLFKEHKNIALYMPSESEIDVTSIVDKKEIAKKVFYLPRLKDKKLIFVRYQKNDPLETNQWNIKEPLLVKENILPAESLDLVIVPIVAFDSDKNRLGRGAGFYDRTFAFKLQQSNSKPFLIGVAYAWQEVEAIEPHEHDVKLDLVVTDG